MINYKKTIGIFNFFIQLLLISNLGFAQSIQEKSNEKPILLGQTQNFDEILERIYYEMNFNNLKNMIGIGGQCIELKLIDRYHTTDCPSTLFYNIFDNQAQFLVVKEEIAISFSGSEDQQPRLDKYTLYLDKIKIITLQGNFEARVAGTCEIDGNPEQEVAKYKCVAQMMDGSEIKFIFRSTPDQIEEL